MGPAQPLRRDQASLVTALSTLLEARELQFEHEPSVEGCEAALMGGLAFVLKPPALFASADGISSILPLYPQVRCFRSSPIFFRRSWRGHRHPARTGRQYDIAHARLRILRRSLARSGKSYGLLALLTDPKI